MNKLHGLDGKLDLWTLDQNKRCPARSVAHHETP